jgi:CxxC-x17-CxxC domain-containing protein
MADKTIICKDCNASFVFTAEEQAFFKEKGYENEPQRCPECRAARKQTRGTSRGGSDREMFPAVCSACGKDTMVPFRPSNDKPVYCKDCFQSRSRY